MRLRVIIVAITTIIGVATLAASAQALDKSDFECRGTLSPAGAVKPLVFEQKLSIDPTTGRWCANRCSVVMPIVRTEGSQIVLGEHIPDFPNGSSYRKVIDADNGILDEVSTTDFQSSPVTIKAACKKAAFSGLDSRTKSDHDPKITSAGITSDDYPPAARRAARTGRVEFWAAVDADGRPLACGIANSSGSADLDYQTCNLVMTRFQFAPATDDAGKPIAGRYLGALNWSLG